MRRTVHCFGGFALRMLATWAEQLPRLPRPAPERLSSQSDVRERLVAQGVEDRD